MDKKTCIITGSSRGIGRGCAILFAKNGYNVVVNYSSNEPTELLNELTEMNASFISIKGDISNEVESNAL